MSSCVRTTGKKRAFDWQLVPLSHIYSETHTHIPIPIFLFPPHKLCRAELLTLALGSNEKAGPRRQQQHPGSDGTGKRSIDPSINYYLL